MRTFAASLEEAATRCLDLADFEPSTGVLVERKRQHASESNSTNLVDRVIGSQGWRSAWWIRPCIHSCDDHETREAIDKHPSPLLSKK